MSERTPEQIRLETAAERQALDDDLSHLHSEIRSLAVFVAAGLVQGREDHLEARQVTRRRSSWPGRSQCRA